MLVFGVIIAGIAILIAYFALSKGGGIYQEMPQSSLAADSDMPSMMIQPESIQPIAGLSSATGKTLANILAASGTLADIHFNKDYVNYANAYDAEIANDAAEYKKLMIVGNKASGRRTVGILDDLYAYGNLHADGDLSALSGDMQKLRTTDLIAEQAALGSLALSGDAKFIGDLYVSGATHLQDLDSSSGEFSNLKASDIIFSRNYSDTTPNAQIANDGSAYRQLVISGNNTFGKRVVGIKDDLAVYGNNSVTGSMDVGGNSNVKGASAVTGDLSIMGQLKAAANAFITGLATIGSIKSGAITSSGAIAASGALSGASLSTSGAITAGGPITANNNVVVAGSLLSTGPMQTSGSLNVGGTLAVGGKISAPNFSSLQTAKIGLVGGFNLTNSSITYQFIGDWCLFYLFISWTGQPSGDWPGFGLPFGFGEQILQTERGSAVDAINFFNRNSTYCYLMSGGAVVPTAARLPANAFIKCQGILLKMI